MQGSERLYFEVQVEIFDMLQFRDRCSESRLFYMWLAIRNRRTSRAKAAFWYLDVAGKALCEPQCADFVAGAALCEPRSLGRLVKLLILISSAPQNAFDCCLNVSSYQSTVVNMSSSRMLQLLFRGASLERSQKCKRPKQRFPTSDAQVF